MKKWVAYGLITLFCVSASGCAAVMVATQPAKKDLRCLKIGTPRDKVVTELGKPVMTDTDEQKNRIDIFQFKQGFDASTKTARALVHTTADVFTLGLWEVVATPAEAFFGAKDMGIKVFYDENDKVKNVVYLKGK